MSYLELFKMPKPMKITGRSSSITNAFINSIIPVEEPTEEQVMKALTILGMRKSCHCSYCGGGVSEWDHLRPLVVNKKPTGYISEIHNLVPACGKCNQSKGNKYWRKWIVSNAPMSPKTRGVKDINQKIKRLKKYEKWCKPTKLNFEKIAGEKIWKEHWDNWHKLQGLMRKSQKLAEIINNKVANAYKKL